MWWMWWQILLAYILDWIVGDPLGKLHPVALIGRLISFLESWLRRLDLKTPRRQKVAGTFLTFAVVSIVLITIWSSIKLVSAIWPILGVGVSIGFISTTIASKGLVKSAKQVHQALTWGDISKAKRLTGQIVGRDTEHLDKDELIRAVIETVAENTVDAVVAPLFYAFLGGAPLAMAYRAINTLDSMVGYKNAQYRHFGWASARLDDMANFIPARLAIVFIPLAAWLLRMD